MHNSLFSTSSANLSTPIAGSSAVTGSVDSSSTTTTSTRAVRVFAGLAATGVALLLATGAASAGTTPAPAPVSHVQPVSAHRPATAAPDVTRIGTAVRYVRGADGQPVLVR